MGIHSFNSFSKLNEVNSSWQDRLNVRSDIQKIIEEYKKSTNGEGNDPELLVSLIEKYSSLNIEIFLYEAIRYFKENGVYTMPASDLIFEMFKMDASNLVQNDEKIRIMEDILDRSKDIIKKFGVYLEAAKKSQRLERDRLIPERPVNNKMQEILHVCKNSDKIISNLEFILSLMRKVESDDLNSINEEEFGYLLSMFNQLLDGGKNSLLSKIKGKSPNIFNKLSEYGDPDALDNSLVLGDIGF
jgi:hypothetical protein